MCGLVNIYVWNSFTLTIVTVNTREGNVSLNELSNAGHGVAERVSLKRDEMVQHRLWLTNKTQSMPRPG